MKCQVCDWLRENIFLVLLLLCAGGGYGLGLSLRSLNFSAHTIHLIGFPGQLVLRAFFMIIVPLLFCSLVLGVSSLRKGGDSRMVAITIAFFLGFSSFSAIMGVTAGHVIHPGQKIIDSDTLSQSNLSGRKGVILDSMLDLLWNSVPENIMMATFMKEYTHVEIVNALNGSNNQDLSNSSSIYRKSLRHKYGVNFMGLLLFSILFGSALATLGEKGEHLYEIINQLNLVVMKILNYFLKILPIGMFFWMFREGLETAAPVELLRNLAVFLATAFGCIAFHQFILFPGLYLLIIRKSPIKFHVNLLPAILTAFGTSSSAATLPVTLRCAEVSNRLNKCVTRFVLPLGMVVHMNGGTFYISLATVFLAQLEGIELGTSETVVLCLTSILLLISAPATISGGNPVYLLTAMAAAGIEKPQFISLVLSMEWLMERFRTVMNVVSDSYVAAFVEKLCAGRLPKEEDEDLDHRATHPLTSFDTSDRDRSQTNRQNLNDVA